MLYRIDFDHFLTHMIDHFTTEEITHMQFIIISASISNGGRASNVVKLNDLYPLPDIVFTYTETQDKHILEKMYMDQLNPKDKISKKSMDILIYKAILNPLELHCDVVIICNKIENDYVDVLCKYLKTNFSVDVIDLNKLFITGRIGPIYIDRDEIHNKCVDIRRDSMNQMKEVLASTRDGRAEMVAKHMTKKEKIHKLNELGVTPSSTKTSELNELLQDAYVNNEDDD